MMFKKKVRYTILFLILLICFFIRVYDTGGIFKSSDEVEVSSAVIRHFPRTLSSFNFLNEEKATSNPIALFLLGHNAASYLFGLLIIIFYNFLKIPIIELSWNIAAALFGTLNIIIIYLFVAEFFDERSALISALFMGLLPLHVYPSRYIGLTHLFLNFFFLVLSVYLFLRFLKDPSKRKAILFSLSLSLYMLASMIFPLVFILIILIGMAYKKEKDGLSFLLSFKTVIKRIFRFDLFFAPILVICFFLGANILNLIFYHQFIGLIDHILNSSQGVHLYVENFINAVIMTVGIPAMIVLAICLLAWYRNPICFKRVSILFMWFIIYSIPFLFLFARETWTMAPYLIEGIGALIIFMSVIIANLHQILGKKDFLICLIKFILVCTVSLSFLAGNFSFIFGLDVPAILDVGNYGTFGGEKYPIKEDFGVKAAGYWIRKNTNVSTKIFSSYYQDEAGIEPPVADYYFHRITYSLYDGDIETSLKLFNMVKDKVEILVLDAESLKKFGGGLIGFYKAARIIDDNGRVKLIIFSKKPYSSLDISIKKGNQLFDSYFANFKAMVDCAKCSSAKLVYPNLINKI